jgi:hypothetical protein
VNLVVIPPMQSDTDKMIAALDAFTAGPNDDDAVFNLYNITAGFDALPDNARVVPSMFAVMERCGGADLGNPGPLVHCIESLAYEHYSSLLVDSIRRHPMYLNVWMINRILNLTIPDDHRKKLLDVLESVVKSAAASPTIVELAKMFLAHQAGVG